MPLPMTPEEAVMMFEKWRSESTRIWLDGKLACGRFQFDCRITDADLSAVALRLSGEHDTCEFSLLGFRFEYKEPPPEHTDSVEAGVFALRGINERLNFIALPS